MKTPEEIQEAIEKIDDLWKTSQHNEAISFANQLLENEEIIDDTQSLAKVYLLLGNVYLNLSENAKALEYYAIALQMYEDHGNKKGVASIFANIGSVYSKRSDFPKALEYFSKALQINEEIGNKDGIASIIGNIGVIYTNLCDYTKALEYYSKALQNHEENGSKKGIGGTLVNIGSIYSILFEYDTALEYFGKAVIILEEINHKDFLSNAINGIGSVYLKLSNYPKALEYYSKSLHINEEIKNKKSIANNLLNIGQVYSRLSDFEKSLLYFEKALLINEEIENLGGIALSYANIGSVFATKVSTFYDAKKSEEYLQKGLVLAEGLGVKNLIQNIYEELHKLQLNEERFKEALEFHIKSIALKEEIFSNEAKKQAERFDIERKSAEREKQLAVEKARYEGRESILRNILPDSVTDRLVKGENPIADHFQSASVLFMDLVGFTTLASIAPPKQLVFLLDAIFQKADEVVESFGLEKIKTIGDGYLVVANVTKSLENHQKATALTALQLIKEMMDFTVNIPLDMGDTEWINNMNDIQIRIGIHTGEVVAGIIGKNKYTYDLWGDAVNVASRMESHSEAGRIHISEQFAKSIEQHPEFKLIPRGEISIKGKGTMNTFWLEKAI